MKKKILALTSAVALTLMSSITAFAAPSPSVGTVVPNPNQPTTTLVSETGTPASYAAITSASTGYTVSAVSSTTAAAADVAVQNLILNNLAAVGAATGNVALVNVSTDATATVTANILATVDVAPTSAVKENGVYTVGLANGMIAAGDTIIVLHWNGSSWEIIYPTSVSEGLVVFQTSDLSPITLVKLTSANLAQAPKTGRSLPVLPVLFVVCAAGAVVCGKKYFA